MDFIEDIGSWMFGGARRNRQRVEERHEADMDKIQALLKSEDARKMLTLAREAAINQGRDYWGRDRGDPYVTGSEDLGKIRKAREEFTKYDSKTDTSVPDISPELAAYFDAAEKSVLDRIKSGGIDPIDRAIKVAGGRASLPKTKDRRDFFAPGEELLEVSKELGKPGIADYFQASTETVPEENVPKTYTQMGIESVDDMAILEDMQKALPEVDMKSEYEQDPELMKKLIELWRAKKLTKKNLHKAFSTIQQSAQQTLGIS